MIWTLAPPDGNSRLVQLFEFWHKCVHTARLHHFRLLFIHTLLKVQGSPPLCKESADCSCCHFTAFLLSTLVFSEFDPRQFHRETRSWRRVSVGIFHLPWRRRKRPAEGWSLLSLAPACCLWWWRKKRAHRTRLRRRQVGGKTRTPFHFFIFTLTSLAFLV